MPLAIGATLFLIAWINATKIVGDLMPPIGVYPERYRVDAFPSAVQLIRLRQSAENEKPKVCKRVAAICYTHGA